MGAIAKCLAEPVAWSREREAQLRELAERAGRAFHAFLPPDGGAARRTSALARWLAALPAPCGVLAANDLRAKEVLDACAEAGVAVPGRVLLLGTDDEEFVCRQTNPTLSSIVPDFAAGGFLEAETLVELLRGRRRRLPPRTYGVAGTARRLSTSDPNEARLMVGRAEEFIRENAGGGDFRIGDAAAAAQLQGRHGPDGRRGTARRAPAPRPRAPLGDDDAHRRDRGPVRLQERRLPQAALPRPPRLHHARLAPPRPRAVRQSRRRTKTA